MKEVRQIYFWPLLGVKGFKDTKISYCHVKRQLFIMSLEFLNHLRQAFLDFILTFPVFLLTNRYMVTALMGFDLDSFLKRQKLTDEHVQFFVYQILRGLKVWTTKCKK